MTEYTVTEYEELEEGDLIRLAQGGERNAFAPLVMKHKDRVFSVIHRSIRDFHLAEELSQEVFVRAYRGIRGFRFDCSLSSWLTRIALNVVATHRTSRRFRDSQVTDSPERELHDQRVANGEDAFLGRERITLLHRCFEKLGDRYQSVLVLVGFEGTSYEDAAEALRVPIGTVRSRLNQARLLLTKCLSLHGGSL